jgi:hypothetical protein
MWGNGAFSVGLRERYLGSSLPSAPSFNGQQLVHYFDNCRMETSNPNGDPASPWLGRAILRCAFMKPIWPTSISALFVDEPDIKIARMTSAGRREGNLSITGFHYLIASSKGVEYLVEVHRHALFSHDEFVHAFTRARLEVHHDADFMPLGRGVYVGVKPKEAG